MNNIIEKLAELNIDNPKVFICNQCGELAPCCLIVDQVSTTPNYCPYELNYFDWKESKELL